MIASAKTQLRHAEKQIESLLERVLDASSPAVIRAYEEKIANLDRGKARLTEKLTQHVPKEGTFDEMLELSLAFHVNLYKFWEKGSITLKRTVLRLTFERRHSYHRNEGARTPKTTFPFKALAALGGSQVRFGAPFRTRTGTPCGTAF